MRRHNSVTTTIACLGSALALSMLTVPQAEAATVRRSLTLTASQSGSGFFEYDNAALTEASSFGRFTDILNAEFRFEGEAVQTVNDPFAAVNFANDGTFLGVDLELSPFSPSLNNVLIANDEVYVPADAFLPEAGATVTYGEEIPTPALLPGLVALGIKTVRKRRKQKQAA